LPRSASMDLQPVANHQTAVQQPKFYLAYPQFFYAVESLFRVFNELRILYVVGIILTAHCIGRKLHFHWGRELHQRLGKGRGEQANAEAN
jgi:hypothetical protein